MQESSKDNAPKEAPPPSGASSFQEPVWTYRGYQLRAGEFTTAMVHFFRAEVQRANIWRQRLDTTTNWAVVTTGAAISFAFTQPSGLHIVLLLNMVMVTLFLSIEARRYRYYELWSYRIRLMETDFFAAMLVPPFHPSGDWAETLAENLLHPTFQISVWEALGRRLRRNYLWIYTILLLAWMAELWLKPHPTASWIEFVQRAGLGVVGGEILLVTGWAFYIFLLFLSLATVGLQQASGEILPRYGGRTEAFITGLFGTHKLRTGVGAWFRPSHHRQQLLTFIITDRAKEVSDRILQEMGRGVTAIAGTGMYTGQAHSVLMIALAVTEVPKMRALVSSADPNAFVVVSPAQEVFGRGFLPLNEEG